MLLPHSQRFAGGYIAFNRPEFIDYFAHHHVQLPLATGDAVFFNPALYHGAGSNISTGHPRGSRICCRSVPRSDAPWRRWTAPRWCARSTRLCARCEAAGRSPDELRNVVVATAEGYAFPTNLDSDQPIGSLAPASEVDIVLGALADDLTDEELDVALRDRNERRNP